MVQHDEGGYGSDDLDILVLLDVEKVRVAAHDVVCAARQRAFKELVVVRVSGHIDRCTARDNRLAVLANIISPLCYILILKP